MPVSIQEALLEQIFLLCWGILVNLTFLLTVRTHMPSIVLHPFIVITQACVVTVQQCNLRTLIKKKIQNTLMLKK